MKLIDRYLVRQQAVPLFICLTGFCFVHVLVDLFDHFADFLDSQVALASILIYYLCVLPPVFEYVAPVSLMLATLYTLWNLSRHHELIALRANGVSLYRLMVPYLITGLLFSVAALAVKELLAPRTLRLAEAFLKETQDRKASHVYMGYPYYNSMDHRHWLIDVYDLERPRVLKGVRLIQETAEGQRARDTFASRAEWLDGSWWFRNVRYQEYDAGGQREGRPTTPRRVPVEIRALTVTPADLQNELRNWEELSSAEMVRYFQVHQNLSDKDRASRIVDLNARLAIPWTCLIATMLAIPAGARTGRQGAFMAITMAILFFFGFYLLIHVGVFLGKRQLVPPFLGAWLPNATFLALGTVMVARMR